MPEITLVRHAETDANHEGIWVGRGDAALSETGESSLTPLGRRLGRRRFDLVLSSPLERARRTAAAFSDHVEVAEELIELDIGRWEGLSRDQILSEDGDLLREAVFGRSTPMGATGESLDDLAKRVDATLAAVADRLGEDGTAALVTHGGFIQEVLHRYLRGAGRRAHAYVANTSITRLTWSYGRPRLATFNDIGHLGPRTGAVARHLEQGDTVLALIRHGQTRANVEGRWQGQGDWGLDEVGHLQAKALRDWYGQVDTVYVSPLGRAQATAGYLATNGMVTVDGLKELSMGEWEGMTSEEIYERWPDLMTRIYQDGVDLKRGGTGESWGELTGRFRATVHDLEPSPSGPTAVVAHGGAIRAYVSSLTVNEDSHSESLFTPANTSVTHVAMTEDGPLLLDFSVAPHLETHDAVKP